MDSLKKAMVRIAALEEDVDRIKERLGPGPSLPVDTSSDTPQPDRAPAAPLMTPGEFRKFALDKDPPGQDKAARVEAAKKALEAQGVADSNGEPK